MTDNFERIRRRWLHSKIPLDLLRAQDDIAWLAEELELQYRIIASMLVTNSAGQSWKERAEAAEAELERLKASPRVLCVRTIKGVPADAVPTLEQVQADWDEQACAESRCCPECGQPLQGRMGLCGCMLRR